MRRSITVFVVFMLVLTSGVLPVSGPAQAATGVAEPTTPTDTPYTLVGSGVASYTLTSPKLFWTNGVPSCPPANASPTENPAGGGYSETIQRIPTYGGVIRTLYNQSQLCGGSQILSNMVTDNDYLYWLGPTGLMRLSTNANPGDPAELVNALVGPYGEVAIASDRVYVLTQTYSPNNMYVDYVTKDNHQKVSVTAFGGYGNNLQTDGTYVYFLHNGSLYRANPGVDVGVVLANNVTGYYPEGSRLLYCTINPFKCYFSNSVYVGVGASIYVYNNNTNTLGGSPIYTSADSTASVRELVSDFSKLYFIESRQVACNPQPCFPSYTYLINRTARSGGAADTLYNYGPTVFTGLVHLTSDGTYLFWQENGMLQRLAGNAAALPNINMRVTGLEVTQGIQNLSNSVVLIKNRRTFVRVYVQSDGPGSVSGVTALLYARNLGNASPLVPVNSTGTSITVRTSPNRNDLNQSFLFELPYWWTQQSGLNLYAEVNPYKTQLEPSYGDNTGSANVSLSNSPSLSVEFFRLNYTIGGTTYSPRIAADILDTYSWILRAYPLGGAVGDYFKPRIWDVAGGTQLGNWVNRSDPVCAQIYSHPNDDISLCASYKTNGWLFYYRVATMMGILNVGLKTNAFYYGMISDAAGFFPRGQAMYSQTSVGPAGIPGLGSGWDFDGSYADWYAAHEIGHSLGRAHPNAGSDNPATDGVYENCGHSRSDPGFPYGNTTTARAPIGPNDGSMEGFDAGDPAFGIARAVYPSSIWNDVMSYCSNQWISDYTYTGMYNYMIAHPSLAAAADVNPAVVTGDLLAVAGAINPADTTAAFSFVRRLSDAVNVPALVPGDYSIRLLGATDNVLATYSFTPDTNNDVGALTFGQVVNFVAGTHKVQIIQNSDSKVLSTVLVSAHAPSISNVALQGAPNPVTGVVTLGWSASDADGDPLTYDIAYSRDSGATFQPVAFGVTSKSTTVDTAQLGGSGTAILRVTASDGVNAASADSAPFVMANKAPQVYIMTPADNIHVHYSQLVNFEGLALDAQDGTVDSTGLVWEDSGGNTLGTGAQLSLDSLPIGSNVISLIATNSVGESASANVTVVVDDDLNLPGPTLTAGPSPVGWQVNVGTTTHQTADVSINNGGSGDLNWTASSDASWLTLNAITGTVATADDPFDLVLTADPTGLAGGKTHVATVTITKPAEGQNPEQTIVIPVTLSIGDVEYIAPIPPAFKVYIPLVVR